MSIFILSCGVFEPELNKVLKEIKEENIFNEYINVKYLPFGLHSNLDKLKSEIVTNLDKIKDNKIILLYGNKCHYKFHDFLKDYDNVITFDDANCIEIIIKNKKSIIHFERCFSKSIKQSDSNRNFRIIKTNRHLGVDIWLK